MTYRETLDWMFGQLPMYQQKGAQAFNAKMDNIIHFSARLGNPERKFKSMHVAGTNGKGSSSHMLASILQEAGLKVGLYTSPHLKDFRERIKIDGKHVGEAFVQTFIAEHREFLEENRLSFFEMTVGMAFAHFASEQVDVAVIEVGLGGRLDSTNIILPEVSLITNIGMDHTQFLGNSLEKIAMEKAGIIKPGVPVVISETQREIQAIFKLIAHRSGSKIVFADQLDLPAYGTDLLGDYQKWNIQGVVACIGELEAFEISEAHIKRGLERVVANTGFKGRWQILGENPLVVCDTAHNKEGLVPVLAQIKKQSYRTLHMVIGFVSDKDVRGILGMFPKEAKYYFVKPDIPRGMKVEELSRQALEQGIAGEGFQSVKAGLDAALAAAGQEDMIFVGGSNFVVAELV